MKTINLKPRSLILINPSEEKAPEIKLKNSNTKRKLTEKQLDALAKGRQKRTQNLKNKKDENIIANISNKHNNLLKELPKQNTTIKIMPDKATINDINNEQYNMKTWQPNPTDEKKIKDATDEINIAKRKIEKYENYVIRDEQRLKELEEELKKLKEHRTNLIEQNINTKIMEHKIKTVNHNIDIIEHNIEQAKTNIDLYIKTIKSYQFAINEKTNFINNLSKK